MAGFPTDLSTYLGNLLGSTSTGGGALGLLGFGSSDPLYNLMALASYAQEGVLTQEQLDFINKVINEQSGAMSTASDPTKLGANINALTGGLGKRLVQGVLGPVDARLAASGQATAPTVRQAVSEEALAPYMQQEQQMGENAAEFGLNLPFQAQPKYPDFSVGQPTQMDALTQLLGGSSSMGTLGGLGGPTDWLNLLGLAGGTGAP